MALFNRDYDRDFGYRGGSGFRGYDRDLGDRAAGGLRRGWNRMTNEVRDAFDAGGYDREYGNRGGSWDTPRQGMPGFSRNSGYDRDLGGRSWWADEAWTQDRDLLQRGAYDRDFTYRGTPGSNLTGGVAGGPGLGNRYGADYNTGYGGYGAGMVHGPNQDLRGYDRDLGARDLGDRDAGRWETDNGDPFGDRQSHTPFRVMRGGFRGQNREGLGYDRDLNRNRANLGYDREYLADYNPNQGGWMPDRDRGFRSTGRGYDRGWF